MAYEIERKFLVASDEWRTVAIGSSRLRDGLIACFGSGKVRVRLDGERGLLTVKGPRADLRRAEYEYEIPTVEAEEMLGTLADGPIVEKTRFQVPHAGMIWEVDVHEGILAGLVGRVPGCGVGGRRRNGGGHRGSPR
ncbi:CYTH domain-containing protein [Belnapia rosea]|uniref:CYTH domain-containing protein n=1 Tax=Belnapia rosea TaxID=938405 RepID=A0A1G7EGH1_9PROT|nr:CYTH domain-containing protein [Belnapia rosea]SDE62535.1 CYTH domain-containing protein [Belnapia rosea]